MRVTHEALHGSGIFRSKPLKRQNSQGRPGFFVAYPVALNSTSKPWLIVALSVLQVPRSADVEVPVSTFRRAQLNLSGPQFFIWQQWIWLRQHSH